MQALIVRDEDYAKGLMENPPEILTLSNPHPYVYVYNLADGTKIDLGQQVKNTAVSSVRTTYWNSENLVFTLISNSQSMGYIYDPVKKEINNL